ncbi:Flp pilus assembly protein TadG [Pseudorhizobium tarimense]|uniref:Flp pilus assembly protein TadG n=1 Tax=Pseudorhizobium tarimense TaxID=1079109 RepID=A0ABV2H1S0_9HYPH|nr:TadE/TadG family type IV pilus assembly protein [Pseudorhizobium tarimense]MCJ8517903.1 pilus assembly protein [Pseudorhizobium tarimense]
MPHPHDTSGEACTPGRRCLPLKPLLHSRDGAAAIEFALLAIPYFLIVFAIIETFIAFTGEQLIGNAVDTMSRKLRTGQITAENTDEAAFRTQFCDEIAILIQCSGAKDNKLILDVRSFSTFADIPKTIPRKGNERFGDLAAVDVYEPGGAASINMLRAYYRWEIITDLVRPYISTIRPSDGSRGDFLIVATAAFKNENYAK